MPFFSFFSFFFPGDEDPVIKKRGKKRKKKKPSDASSKHTLIGVNIRPTWNRFQNRTSYWSLTNLLTVSAAWRRPLVADLSVTDCHSPAMFAAPTSSDTRCCPRKVARAIVMSSPKLFTQQTRRPCAGRKFLIFSLKQQRASMGILFRSVIRQKRGQIFNDVVTRKMKISPQLRLSPQTDAVDVFSHAGFIELEKICWSHTARRPLCHAALKRI